MLSVPALPASPTHPHDQEGRSVCGPQVPSSLSSRSKGQGCRGVWGPYLPNPAFYSTYSRPMADTYMPQPLPLPQLSGCKRSPACLLHRDQVVYLSAPLARLLPYPAHAPPPSTSTEAKENLPGRALLPTACFEASLQMGWEGTGIWQWMSTGVFGCHTWRRFSWRLEARDVIKHPTMHKPTPTTKNYLAQCVRVWIYNNLRMKGLFKSKLPRLRDADVRHLLLHTWGWISPISWQWSFLL